MEPATLLFLRLTEENIKIFCSCGVSGVMMKFDKTIRAPEKPIKESERQRLRLANPQPLVYFQRKNK